MAAARAPGDRLPVVALRRAHEDFIDATASTTVIEARDGSAALDALLDRLDADALVVRPDRYWWRVIPRGGSLTEATGPTWRIGSPWLKDGNVVEVEIGHVGLLGNRCRKEA